MDFTGNLSGAISALPAEAQPLIKFLMDRLDALESKEAADLNALADKVIAAVVPQLQAVTQTFNAVADQTLSLLRRVDGASIRLGPEPPA